MLAVQTELVFEQLYDCICTCLHGVQGVSCTSQQMNSQIMLQSEHSLLFHRHTEEIIVCSWYMDFPGKRKASAKLSVENESTCTVIFFQPRLHFQSLKCHQILNALSRQTEKLGIWLTYWISIKEQHWSSQDWLKHLVVQSLWRINKDVEYQQWPCYAEEDSGSS
jgi:hypothetical protein